MKNKIFKITTISILLLQLFACTDLDLQPLDQPTSAPFTGVDQFRFGLNEGYRATFWKEDASFRGIDDDSQYRADLDRIKAGTLNSEDGTVGTIWAHMYKAIARINSVKNQIIAQDGILTDYEKEIFLGEANFLLASYWSYMITHFGDIVYFEEASSLEEAFMETKTSKLDILAKVYSFYDQAIVALPVSYSGHQYATKGAAMAMKARVALYMEDYTTAAAAAEACMDLDEYALYPNYSELFLPETKNTSEGIFTLPRTAEYENYRGDNIQYFMPRNFSGWGAKNPTWALLASYECTDGLPIDESPLFDPQNPFKNRDPRCAATIIPFGSLDDGDGLLSSDGSNYLGIEYTPHPERKEVLNFETNALTKNNDTRSTQAFASFNGLLWKKGIDDTWKEPFRPDPDRVIMRYADVLLMYAEAKMELNEIDATVLGAINEVRDRAYAGSGIANPTVTATAQSDLRYVIRNERRAEFAFEGLRYMDIIRWRIAQKAITGFSVGLADVVSNGSVTVAPTGDLMDNVVTPGLWFWGMTPELDVDGIADFQPLVAAGMAKNLIQTEFPERQYLYPLPAADVLLVPTIAPNNTGY